VTASLRRARERIAAGELQDRCEGVAELAAVEGEEATHALAELLNDPSWYLRERVVEALVARPDAAGAVTRVLREGDWFARASACDVVGRVGDLDAAADVIAQVEDRNVSLQKSAVRALRRLAEAHGSLDLARRIAALPDHRRRRALTRIGHQEPRWARELEHAMAGFPPEAFGAIDPDKALPAVPDPGAAERAIVRFRKWLAELSPEGGRR
jgi:HEAT repeat protein